MKLKITRQKVDSNRLGEINRSVYTASIGSRGSKLDYSSSISGNTYSVLKSILSNKNIILKENSKSAELLSTSVFVEDSSNSPEGTIVSTILSDFNANLVHVRYDSILYFQASDDTRTIVGTKGRVNDEDSKRDLYQIFSTTSFRRFVVQIDGDGDCFMSDLSLKNLLQSLHLQTLKLSGESIFVLKKQMVEIVEIE